MAARTKTATRMAAIARWYDRPLPPWPGDGRHGATALGSASLVRERPPGTGAPGADRPLGRRAGPRLGDRARAAMRLRRFSPRTEEVRIHGMRRYDEFHGRRNPADLGAEHVTAFPNALAARRRVATSTRNQALSALLSLHRDVLESDFTWLDDLVSARSSVRLPD